MADEPEQQPRPASSHQRGMVLLAQTEAPEAEVEEMVVQCPYPEATAFMYAIGTCDYDYEQDIWTAETIYYTGDMPEEIRNREIEW